MALIAGNIQNVTYLSETLLATGSTSAIITPEETTGDETPQETSMYRRFDRKVASIQPGGTAQSRATIEVQRYLEEPPISRHEDPIKWWKNNSYNFPHLSELVKRQFITVATSVPCERLFSKSGQILSDRRSRLSSTKVKQILFINCNRDLKT